MYYQNRPGPRGYARKRSVGSADHLLPIPHIHQEKSCYCGPASLQMVMIANGLPFPTQYSLYVTESHELIAGHVQPANESGACTQLTEKGGVWKSGSTPE